MTSRTHLLTLLVALLPLACHPARQRAETALAEARYPDALSELIQLEAGLPRHGPRWQAHYSLERGLAHLAVGDVQRATLWLERAWSWREHDPHLFTPHDRARLVAAWRAMGVMPGQVRSATRITESSANSASSGGTRCARSESPRPTRSHGRRSE